MLFLTLGMLRHDAYKESGEKEKTEEEWVESRKASSPTVAYWDLIMRLQMLAFMFVRSLRQRCLDLYVNCLDRLVALMFILDATNYSRWLPFHVRDMKSLPASVKQMFQAGYFTVTKTIKPFSSMSIDQAHEQTNKDVKSSGGATGFFHDHLALLQ